MTDITEELKALPKMPDPKGPWFGNAFVMLRLVSMEARLSLSERLLRTTTAELEWWVAEHGCCEGHEGTCITDDRAYLQHREKEQQT